MRLKLLAVLTFILFSVATALAGTETVLYSFAGGTDGSNPYQAGVVFDQSGNLYGVTEYGGLYGDGTVFQLTPSPGGGWTENILYNFTGTSDGRYPSGGLVIDGSRNLYGTAWESPMYCCGVVFRLSPSQGGWTYTVLYTFTGNDDGEDPQGDLMLLGSSLVGTTYSAGWQCGIGNGTVFIVSTSGGFVQAGCFRKGGSAHPAGVGVCETVICGTSATGGKEGAGSLFRWYPYDKEAGTMITFKPSAKYGINPYGDLTSNAGGGAIFGTTSWGGVGGKGTVYKLTPVWHGPYANSYRIAVVHSFTGANGDGAGPWGGVILDAAGNIYGTTAAGGSDPGSGGTVFKLTPVAKNKWDETVLYSFSGGADGSEPTGSIIFDSAGNIYGTTYEGGAYGNGVVYEVAP